MICEAVVRSIFGRWQPQRYEALQMNILCRDPYVALVIEYGWRMSSHLELMS